MVVDESWVRAREVAGKQGWLLCAGQARAAGLTPHQIRVALRNRGLASLYPGVYLLDPDLAGEAPLRTWWSAALMAHGPRSCLVGWTGARAIGAAGLPPADPSIDVAVVGVGSRHRRPTEAPFLNVVDGPPIVVRQWPVRADEVEMVQGLRVRRPPLTLVDAALCLDRVHALCLFDWGLHAGVFTPAELIAMTGSCRRRPGVIHVRQAAALADGRAASPLESRVRLACVDGQLAPDELQYPVRDASGRIVGYGDLAWLQRHRPLIGEADGREPHSLPEAVLHDRRRANEFVIGCCDIVRFTWADSLRPAYIRQTVRRALAS